jgi:hypothetical protein
MLWFFFVKIMADLKEGIFTQFQHFMAGQIRNNLKNFKIVFPKL